MLQAMRLVPASVVLSALALAASAEAQPPPPEAVVRAPALDPTQEMPRGTGLILGQVVDAASGRPIAAAVVTLGVALQAPRVLADNEGRFLFRDVAKGSYAINAAKGGYVNGALGQRRPAGPGQQLELADGERRGDVTIPMWRHGAIEGMVVDEAGQPVPALQMRAYLRSSVGGRRTWRPAGTSNGTDDRGIYRIWNLIPGDYIVGIESTTVALPADVAEATQMPMTPSDPARMALLRELMTATGGGFAAAGVRIGDLVQTIVRAPTPPPPAANAPMFVYPTTFYPAAVTASSASVLALRSGEERVGIDMQLRPVSAVRVSGVLTGPDGPVPAVALRLVPAGADEITALTEISTAAAVSDAGGAFTFLGVTPGQYMVRVAKAPVAASPSTSTTTTIIQSGSMMMSTVTGNPGGALPPPLPSGPTLWASVPIAVGNRDLSEVVIGLQTGGRIRGRLEFDGAAETPTAEQLQRTAIIIEPAGARPPGMPGMTTGRVDASGQFTTMGIVGGRYFIRSVGAPPRWTFKSATFDGRDLADTPIEIGAGDVTGVVITFTDRPSELTGRVTGDGGNADAGATVLVFPTDTAAWGDQGLNPRRVRAVRTTPTGAYFARNLPPGEYYAVAVPDELAADWQDPRSLEVLARDATTIRIDDGQKKAQDLATKRVAR